MDSSGDEAIDKLEFRRAVVELYGKEHAHEIAAHLQEVHATCACACMCTAHDMVTRT